MDNTISSPEKIITEQHNSKIDQRRLPCPDPECGSSDAYHLYDDGHGYCFSCRGYFSNGIKDNRKFTYEYLSHWNVSADTFRKYKVKTKIDESGQPISVGFMYPNKAIQVRLLGEKKFYTEGDYSNAGLFGTDVFPAGCSKTLTITEGAKDALCLHEATRTPVVAVKSTSSAHHDVVSDYAYVNAFEQINLCFDADGPGREALGKVARLFDYNKVRVVRLLRKDPGEYLDKGERDQLKALWLNAGRYLPDNLVSSLSEFKKILDTPRPLGISYPFKKLNDMTGGIHKARSVLFTAQEGIGKTEFMHALEYHVLKETNDAVGAIYLEETERDHLEAMAGIEATTPIGLPNCGVNSTETYRALQNLVRADDRLHVYRHFGSDDPSLLIDTIRFLVSARGCGYIFLDHVTLACSGLAGEKERVALDHFVTKLEMLLKELEFALLMVSHVNDDGLTRGSRMISKVADVRIDLHRNLQAATEEEKNTLYLNISKNRPPGGKTGPAGSLVFNPNTRRYVEKEDNFDV